MARRIKAGKVETINQALRSGLEVDLKKSHPHRSSLEARPSVDVEKLARDIALSKEESAKFSRSRLTKAIFSPDKAKNPLFTPKGKAATSGTVEDAVFLKNFQAANDDKKKRGLSHVLPTNTAAHPYWTSTALSTLWGVGGLLVANSLAPSGLFSSSFASFLGTPVGMSVLAATVIPIMSFCGFAQLTKRAKEIENLVHLMRQRTDSSTPQQPVQNQKMEAVANKVRTDVLAMEDGIQRTLSRAAELEALVHGGVQNLERAYQENEIRIHKLIKELSNEREAILRHAERVTLTLEKTRHELSGELTQVSAHIAGDVENAATHLGAQIEQKAAQILSDFHKASDSLTAKTHQGLKDSIVHAASSNQNLLKDLSDRFSRIHDHFSKINVDLVEDLKTSLADTENKAEIISKKMSQAAVQSVNEFDKIFAKLENAFSDRSGLTFNRIDERLQTLDRSAGQIVNQLGEKFDTLDHMLEQRSAKVFNDFDNRTEQLTQRGEEISGTFEKHIQKTITDFAQHLSSLQQVLSSRSEGVTEAFLTSSKKLEDNTQKLSHLLEQKTAFLETTFKEGAQHIEGVLTTGQEAFFKNVENTKVGLASGVAALQDSLQGVFKKNTDDLLGKIEHERLSVDKALADKNKHIVASIQEQLSLLNHHMDTIEQALGEKLTDVDTKAQHHMMALNTRTEAMEASVKESVEVVKTALDRENKNIQLRVDALKDTLSVNSVSLNQVLAGQAEALEERIDKIRDLILHGNEHFNLALEDQMKTFKDMLADTNHSVKGSFAEHLETLEQHAHLLKNVLDHSNVLRKEVQLKSNDLNKSFEEHIALLADQTQIMDATLRHGVQNVCEDLQSNSLLFNERLQETISASAANFKAQTKQIESFVETIDHKLDDNVQNFEKKLSIAHQTFSEDTYGTVEKVAQSLQQTAENFFASTEQTTHNVLAAADTVAASLASTTHTIEERLAERSAYLQNTVMQFEDRIQARLDSVGDKLNEVQDATQEHITHQMQQLTQATRSVYDVATHTSDSFGQLANHVSEQLTIAAQDAYQRLAKENDNLANAFSGRTAQIINTVKAASSGLSENFALILQKLEHSSAHINQTAQSIINNISHVDQRFVEAADNFSKETSKVSHSIGHSTDMLNTNIQYLEKLSQESQQYLSQLTTGFSEHANVLMNAADMLDKSQNNISLGIKEKHEMLSALSESLNKKSQDIVHALEYYQKLIMQTFSKVHDQASSSTSQTQILYNSMTSLVKESASRFIEASEKVAGSARDIEADLKTLNENIGYNLQVLPTKTEQTTKILKDALAEQVGALNQLTSVVEKAEKLTQTRLKALPTKMLDTSISDTLKDSISVHEKNKKIRPSSYSEQSFHSTSKPSSTEHGWLSDLLNRASKNAKEIPAAATTVRRSSAASSVSQPSMRESLPHTPPSLTLNQIFSEAARGVNTNALSRLWTSYDPRKRNIYESELYTRNGLEVFHKIRQSYASDAKFKEEANSFMQKFEEVLNEGLQNKNNPSLLRECYTSTSGKLYTMLAHASNRIR